MAATRQQPSRFIAIHDRTPSLCVLYISSSIRQALLYEPDEFIGCSAPAFIADHADRDEYIRHYSMYTEDNVIMTKVVARRKDNKRIFLNSIAFACSNITFHLATTYPNVNVDRHNQPLSIQKFRCILSESNTKHGRHALYSEQNTGEHGSSHDNRGTSSNRFTKRGMYRSMLNSMKKARQACIVLEGLHSNSADGSRGPRVIFSTNSINRILNADSCDLQHFPFLSMVTLEDITKAADFLDKALQTNVLVLERLRLLENPIENEQQNFPKCVSVEFMAMGSDDGAIMLCQLEQPKRADPCNNDGYLSLEDIISSDPGTSDFVM